MYIYGIQHNPGNKKNALREVYKYIQTLINYGLQRGTSHEVKDRT